MMNKIISLITICCMTPTLAHGASPSQTLWITPVAGQGTQGTGTIRAEAAIDSDGADLSPNARRAAVPAGGVPPLAPDNLRVNDMVSPVGTSDRVHYGWWVHDADTDEVQSAFQILLASTPGKLALGTADVWDSGRVDSNLQNHVPHKGAALVADHRYHWMVRTWDKDGNVSPWSAPAHFTVGLLGNNDWAGASWIRRDTTDPDDYTYYRRQVTLPAKPVERATIHVAAMHKYVLYFNDTLVGKGPAYQHPQYQYHNSYDVTKLVRAGGINQFALLNHWFGGGQGRPAGSRGVLLKAIIRYTDGTTTEIGTDGTWKQSAAASWVAPRTRRNNDAGYIERIDGRLLAPGWYLTSFDDAGWATATVIGPQPVSPWIHPPAPDLTRITETVIAPASITHKGDGTYLIDLGKTYSGTPRIRFSGGTVGDEVRMRGGDMLDSSGLLPNGTLSQNTDMEYRAFLTGGEFTFEPFEYLGMRYFQIDNAPMPVTAENFGFIFRHTMIDAGASSFTSPNRMLNEVWELMKHSVVICAQEQFVDTPTREKGGFLRDAAVQSTIAMPTLGERLLTRRSLGEFLQSMDQHWRAPDDRGRINAVYPNNDGARDIPDFTQAFPIWAWNYYMETGDLAFLTENYGRLRETAEYVHRHIDPATGLVTRLTGGSGDYLHGIIDWPPPMRYGYDMSTAARTVINGWAHAGFDIMSRIAGAVGNASDQRKYRAMADKLAQSINARLINDAGLYSDGLSANGLQSANTSQHANMFPLALGIVPDANHDAVVAEVKNRRMSVGMVTLSWLIRALGEARQGPHLIDLFTQTKWDGWARCLTLGATTTWESWSANERHTSESMSHGWGAAGMEGYYRYILGIVPTAPQYERLQIRPLDFGESLASASGHIRTDRGDIHVQWQRAASSHTLKVRLPVNTTADIFLPRGSAPDWQVLLDGEPVAATVVNGQIKIANVGSGARSLIRNDLAAPSP
jgi:alpha-L-rhamnosidase